MYIKFLKKIINLFGIDVIRYTKQTPKFVNVYKKKIKKNPLIFDVGSNKGQTVDVYLNIFKSPSIHCFEPNIEVFNILKKKYYQNKKIKLNNFAFGNKNEKKKFNVTAKSGSSSFYSLNKKTKWIKQRAKEFGTTPSKYVKKIINVKLKKLDEYVANNKIKKIDLLKIDTQGSEKNILIGSKKTLKKGIINAIELELMLDDCYNVNSNFYSLEKILIPNGFRLVGLDVKKKDLFTNINFGANALYMHDERNYK